MAGNKVVLETVIGVSRQFLRDLQQNFPEASVQVFEALWPEEAQAGTRNKQPPKEPPPSDKACWACTRPRPTG